MSTRPLLLKNARVVDPATGFDGPGGVLVEDGLIKACDPDLAKPASVPEGAEVVDCGGHILAPGLVDSRVFIGEPGGEHKETIASASLAAAAGGVTTIIMMPSTEPVIDDAALVDYIERRSRDAAIVRVHTMAALTKGLAGAEMTEMALLAEAGAVGFTDGNRSVANSQVLRRAMQYATTIDGLIAHHAEDAYLSTGGQMNEGELATRLGLQGISGEAESIVVDRDLALARLTGARYHLAHASTRESLASIARAKDAGLKVTCAVTPHHLALNELDIATYRTFLKTNPPLRTEDVRQRLVEGLLDGTIDVVATSHDPRGPEDKRLPFQEAAFGAVGLETLLPILLELVHKEEIGLMRALEAATWAPARLLGLEAGAIRPGWPADLILVDFGAPFVLDATQLKSRSKNTPFDGRKLQGRAVLTLVGGKIVHSLLEGEDRDVA